MCNVKAIVLPVINGELEVVTSILGDLLQQNLEHHRSLPRKVQSQELIRSVIEASRSQVSGTFTKQASSLTKQQDTTQNSTRPGLQTPAGNPPSTTKQGYRFFFTFSESNMCCSNHVCLVFWNFHIERVSAQLQRRKERKKTKNKKTLAVNGECSLVKIRG